MAKVFRQMRGTALPFYAFRLSLLSQGGGGTP